MLVTLYNLDDGADINRASESITKSAQTSPNRSYVITSCLRHLYLAALIYNRKIFNSSVYMQQIVMYFTLSLHDMFRLVPTILRCSQTKTMSTYVKITIKPLY
jgi:hypothetical protein